MATLVINNSQNSVTEVRHETVLTVNPTKSRVLQVSSDVHIAEVLKTETVTAYAEVERTIDVSHQTVVEILNRPEPDVLEICHGGPTQVISGESPQINVIVPAGQTRILDSVAANLVKWVVFGENRVSGATSGFEVLGARVNGAVDHSVYGIVGEFLPCDSDAYLSGGSVTLTMTNFGDHDLYFSLKRMALSVW